MVRIALLTGLAAWCAVICTAHAQVPDTVRVPEAVVVGERLPLADRSATGTAVSQIDSTLLIKQGIGLNEAVRTATVLNLREYGPGGIATLTMRGAGASHTGVLWQGMSLNDPMLGMADLSVLMLLGASDVRVLHGPAAQAFGPGQPAGAIDLRTTLPTDSAVHAQAEFGAGSFGLWKGGAGAAVRKGRWAASVAGAAVWAKNDFTFTDLAQIGHPTNTMTNSGVSQQGATGSLVHELNRRNRLRLDGLYLRSDRQLPPTMVSPAARDALLDEKALLILGWERNGLRSASDVRASYAYSDQDFFDSQADTNYLNRSHTFRIRAAQQLLGGRRFTIIARLNSDMAWGRSSSGYADGVFRHLHQATLSLIHRPLTWLSGEAQVGLQSLNTNVYPGPFLIGTSIRVMAGWELRANLSTNMRFPTLNDLYWFPGGNIALLPEHQLAAEVGTRLDRRIKAWHVLAAVQFFVAGYSDLIQWQPGQSYWIPENVRSTINKGTETELGLDFNLKRMSLMFRFMHQWNRAFMDVASYPNDPTLGQQLIYVPEHQAKMIFSLELFGASLGADAQFISSRNVASDGSSTLLPYWLAATHIGYRFQLRQVHSIYLRFSINNIFDQQYQTMAWRPMPGRNWAIGLRYWLN